MGSLGRKIDEKDQAAAVKQQMNMIKVGEELAAEQRARMPHEMAPGTYAAQPEPQAAIPGIGAPMPQAQLDNLISAGEQSVPQAQAQAPAQLTPQQIQQERIAKLVGQNNPEQPQASQQAPRPGIGAPMPQAQASQNPAVDRALAAARQQASNNANGGDGEIKYAPAADANKLPTDVDKFNSEQQAQVEQSQTPVELANAPAAPQTYTPEAIEKRKGDIAISRGDAVMQTFASPNLMGFKALLDNAADGKNETDKMAPKLAEKASEAAIRDRMANAERSLTESGIRYEQSIKKSPWYKNNSLWAAAIGFGLARLAGADPRTGMAIAGMSAMDAHGKRGDYLRNMQINHAADLVKLEKVLDEVHKDKISSLEKGEEYEQERSDTLTDADTTYKRDMSKLDAKQGYDLEGKRVDNDYDLNKLSIEQGYKSEESVKDRTSAQATAKVNAETREKYKQDDRDARSEEGRATRKLIAVPKIRKLDRQIKDSEDRAIYAESMLTKIESASHLFGPGAGRTIGPAAKFVDSENGQIVSEAADWAKIEVPGKLEAMRGLGSMSEVEFKSMTADIPSVTDPASKWARYIGRLKAHEEKAREFMNRERTELEASFASPVRDVELEVGEETTQNGMKIRRVD